MKAQIKKRIFALMHRRGGVWEISDGCHYQSLLTSDEEIARDYLEYLCETFQVNAGIFAGCMRAEWEELFLERKPIPPGIALFLAIYSS